MVNLYIQKLIIQEKCYCEQDSHSISKTVLLLQQEQTVQQHNINSLPNQSMLLAILKHRAKILKTLIKQQKKSLSL